jgi:probable rRNA maturation factor
LTAALEVEVLGLEHAPGVPGELEIAELCRAAAASAGVRDGHLAIEFVDAATIAQLNQAHRGKLGPTDVLSFPIDELEPQAGVERELGDVIICCGHTVDLREAIVHGILHLLGMDHEIDQGQMLAAQAEILSSQAHSGGGRR